MIGEFSYLCKLEIITSVIELNPAHGVTGKPWWNSNTQSGTTGGVEIAANSMQTVDVIFKKPFNAIPTIVCTLKSGSNITTYGDLTAFVDYGSVTKKGFTIKVSNSCATLGAKPCVSWIATVLWNSNKQGALKNVSKTYLADKQGIITTEIDRKAIIVSYRSNDAIIKPFVSSENNYWKATTSFLGGKSTSNMNVYISFFYFE